MEFGPPKCVSLHIGGNNTRCPELKVHQTTINSKSSAIYLGDQLWSDATNDATIEVKRNQGVGAVSQIMSLVDQVTLGHYFFEVLLILRDSMFVSKLLLNAEVWYNISKRNYTRLEEIYNIFWRKSLNVIRTVPKESLYITTGKVPLKYERIYTPIYD